jgi:hypothetical protein
MTDRELLTTIHEARDLVSGVGDLSQVVMTLARQLQRRGWRPSSATVRDNPRLSPICVIFDAHDDAERGLFLYVKPSLRNGANVSILYDVAPGGPTAGAAMDEAYGSPYLLDYVPCLYETEVV